MERKKKRASACVSVSAVVKGFACKWECSVHIACEHELSLRCG